MTELPKSVKSRLRQGGGENSAHPDANLLAAFSEQALAVPEREQVLAHLAACADCREVVALALPPADEKPMVELARSGWGWRPEFMRWAMVGASAAVVVAAVFLVRPELQSPQNEFAKLRVDEAKVADKVASAPVVAQETEAKSAKVQKKTEGVGTMQARGATSAQVAEMAPAAPLPSPVIVASGSGAALGAVANARPDAGVRDERTSRIDGSDVVRPEALAKEAAAKPGSQPALEDRDAAKARANESELYSFGIAVTTKDEAARVETARAAAKNEGAKAEEAKNTDQSYVVLPAPKAARAMERAAAKQKADDRPLTMRAVNPNPRTWRIMDGKLQWSLDGGQTWAFVKVPGDVKVLSVDSRQSSLWVGGTSGVVLRSPDNGMTWTPVTGSGWSGDVVYLRFQDAQHGTLRTSTREEWVTADGGLSWKKQGP